MPERDLEGEILGSITAGGSCRHHGRLRQSQSPEEAKDWHEAIKRCPPPMARQHERWLCVNDLFYFLVYVLNRSHFIDTPRRRSWTFARCREVQAQPDNYLDLWGREGFKSEIITFGRTLQDIIIDPEQTIAFFSHTRPMSCDFLGVIKRECEINPKLYELFPDIFWQTPRQDCLNSGVSWTRWELTFKRKGNPKEATIEAWGLVDGQPTGKRYKKLIYDDVVSRTETSFDMIHKTTVEFNNSLLLTAADPPQFRYIATFQEFDDTTQNLIERGIGNVRLRPAIDPETHEAAYMSDEKLAWFKSNLDAKTFALNLLLDPSKAKDPAEQGFREEWINYYEEQPPRRSVNCYILVDPAGDTAESNSYFALIVVGLGADRRIRILDMVWDKLDLQERWEALLGAVQKWEPFKVGYEKYAFQSDINFMRIRMKEVHYEFTIIECSNPHLSKKTRIEALIPTFKKGEILLPKTMVRTLKDGREVDLVKHFIRNEFLLFPYTKHKDMLDALARIHDPALGIVWPRNYGSNRDVTRGERGFADAGMGGWMQE